MPTSEACKHHEFASQVIVTRVTRSSSDLTVIAYRADVQVRCKECTEPFRFVGVPVGYTPMHPTVSADGLELRVPIEPIYDPQEAGKDS